MKKLILIAILALCFSCAGTRKTTSEFKEVTKTNTFFEQVRLDTAIVIPGQKVELFIPTSFLCPEDQNTPKVFTQKNGRANVKATVSYKGIHIDANCDSIAQQLQFLKTTIKQEKEAETLNKDSSKKKGYSLLELLLISILVGIFAFVAGYK